MNINITNQEEKDKKWSILNQKDNLFDILHTKESKLIEIQRKDIPQDAIKCFEWYSRRFLLPEEYKKWNFEKYRYIQHDGYTTYIATQDKNTGNFTEKEIYIYEKDMTWAKIWHGEIRLWITENPYFKDKPFVWFTRTEHKFIHKWYGKKRMITMNTICKQIRWLPLDSWTLFSHKDAKKIRETLKSQWVARKYAEKAENNADRFQFIEKKNRNFTELASTYNASGNIYHNRSHISNCLDELEANKDLAEDYKAIKDAVLFHDIIYLPWKRNNEEESALFAENYLKNRGESEEYCHKVRDLVLITKHNETPVTKDQELIIDIDLAILWQDEQTYQNYTNHVKQEYQKAMPELTDEQFYFWRKNFLEKFLQKDKIYFTKRFSDKYESQARQNLQKEFESLQKKLEK